MRTTCISLLTVCLIGCADASRTDTATAPAPPTVTRPDEPARPAATPADSTTPPTDAAQGEARTVLRPIEPDNTGVNARDANRTTREPKLPIDQKENQADIDLTAKIRSRVVGTDGFSINARNIKIVTADGKVTLRGPVESAAERERIATIAREVAGNDNVDDQIEVKAAADTAPSTSPPPAPTATPSPTSSTTPDTPSPNP